MAGGIGFLFDPLKNLMPNGMNLFGGPPTQMPPAGGLLRAGGEPPVGPLGGPSLQKAGMEGGGLGEPRAISMAAEPPMTPPIIGHETPAPGPSTIPPPAGVPTTPTASPQYAPTSPLAGESSNPLHPATAAPGAAPAAVPAAAPAPTGGGSAPGATPTTQVPGRGGLDRLGDMGKALGAAGGAKPAIGGHAPGGVGAAHTPDGQALMAAVMKAQQDKLPKVGGVPGMPEGLLRRFKQGG